MRNYAVVQSFLMLTSVLASPPFHIVRQATTPPSAKPPSTPPVVTAGSTTSTVPATNPPVVTPPLSTLPPLSTPILSLSTLTPSTTSSVAITTSSSLATSSSSVSSISSATTPTSITTSTSDGIPTTVVVLPSSTDTSSSASPTPTGGSGDSSVHSGTIIGLSVAGGVAALAIIAFIIWKLTRKRFSGLDDPDEAIKWPELNHQSHSPQESSDVLSRQFSTAYSGGPSRNQSMFDQGEVADPYAVPPLPHLNPNQPYRDDPYTTSNVGYYDPYRGPVPQSFQEPSVDGHENIPMNTYPPGSRTRSPGPAAAYGAPVPGRASPGPAAMYDMGGPGRMASPAPAGAMGLDRRQSPGPQLALSGQPEMTTRM